MKRSGKRARRLGERMLVVLAAAARPLGLREIARAVGAYDSSARYALARLVERALVSHAEERYTLSASGQIVEFEFKNAVRVLGVVEALRLMAAPNSSLAFVSLHRDGSSADVVLSEIV